MLTFMPKHAADIFALAKRGAEARFRELLEETTHLIGLFPHLRDSFDRDELPISFILAKGAGRLVKQETPRRRRRMSAAARKAVSDRMSTYWAAKRKAAAKV
jgi:hypothetical protein